MSAPFAGKNVLITGANRGIGLELANGFLAAGAAVAIAALESDVEAVAAQLSTTFDIGVRAQVCDISDPAQIPKLRTCFDRIDVLINNAGFEYPTPIADSASWVDEVFTQIINTNVIGTFAVTRQLLAQIPDRGRIINTASMWGKTGVAEFSGYCASKHAVIGLTRALARELAPRRISVNAVCPGWVRTAASMRSLSSIAAREDRSEADALADIVAAQALDGLMEPSDMIAIYQFLAGPAADNITGQSYTVDRGELLR